jgi:hypothetical protein
MISITYHMLVTAESIRQSWDNPEYSMIEVPGYAVDENDEQPSRNSSSLTKAMEDALRKVRKASIKSVGQNSCGQFMPQQGTSNLRIL